MSKLGMFEAPEDTEELDDLIGKRNVVPSPSAMAAPPPPPTPSATASPSPVPAFTPTPTAAAPEITPMPGAEEPPSTPPPAWGRVKAWLTENQPGPPPTWQQAKESIPPEQTALDQERPSWDRVKTWLTGGEPSPLGLLQNLSQPERASVGTYLDKARRLVAEAESRLPPEARSNAQGPSPIAEDAPGRVPLSESLVPNQFGDKSLSAEEALAACGPVAAVAFARATGRNPTLREALDLAKGVGWTAQHGMAGPQSQVELLKQMGVASTLENNVDWAKVRQQVEAGNPVIIDSPGHYFVAVGYDAESGKFNFGASGSALRRGSAWMSPDEVGATGMGTPRATIYLAAPASAATTSATPPSATTNFSPFDGVFRKYAGSQANNPEFIAIVAAGTFAESKHDPNAVGDNGAALGLFQMHERGAGAGMGDARRDPDAASAVMVPKYLDAYNRLKAQGYSGADLASRVAAEAEKPAGWDNPNSDARRNYASAYQTVTAAAPTSATPPTAMPSTTPSPAAQAFLDSSSRWLEAAASIHGTSPAEPEVPMIKPPKSSYAPPPSPPLTGAQVPYGTGLGPGERLPGERQLAEDYERRKQLAGANAAETEEAGVSRYVPPRSQPPYQVPYGEGFGPGEGTRAAETTPPTPGVPPALTGAGGAAIGPAGAPTAGAPTEGLAGLSGWLGNLFQRSHDEQARAGRIAGLDVNAPQYVDTERRAGSILDAEARAAAQGNEWKDAVSAVPAIGRLPLVQNAVYTIGHAMGGGQEVARVVSDAVREVGGNIVNQVMDDPRLREIYQTRGVDAAWNAWWDSYGSNLPAPLKGVIEQGPIIAAGIVAEPLLAARGAGVIPTAARAAGAGAAALDIATAGPLAPVSPGTGAALGAARRFSREALIAKGVAADEAARVAEGAAARGVHVTYTPEERAARIANRQSLTEYDTPEVMDLRAAIEDLPSTNTIGSLKRVQARERWAEQAWNAAHENIGGDPTPGASRRTTEVRNEQTLDIVIGGPGSGKSALANKLADDNGAMIIDADNVKRLIPEYIQSKGRYARQVHQESSDIVENRLINRALAEGENTILPMVGNTPSKIGDLIDIFSARGFRVRLHYVDLEPEEAARRAMDRFSSGGQGFVDPDYILNQVGRRPGDTFATISAEGRGSLESIQAYSNAGPRIQPIDTDAFIADRIDRSGRYLAGRVDTGRPQGARAVEAAPIPATAAGAVGKVPAVATTARKIAETKAPEVTAAAAGGIAGLATGEEDEQGQRDIGTSLARAALGFGAGLAGTATGRRIISRALPYRATIAAQGTPSVNPGSQGSLANAAVDAMLNKPPAPGPGIGERIVQTKNAFVRQFFDRGTDLAQFQNKIERDYMRTTGQQLPPEAMAEALWRVANSGTDWVAAVGQQRQIFPALRELGTENLADLRRYLTHQDNLDKAAAIERRVAGKGGQRMFSGGLLADDSAAGLNDMQASLGPQRYGAVEKAAQSIYGYVDSLRQRMVDSGLWSQGLANELKQDFPHYAPVQIVDYVKDQQFNPSGAASKLSAPAGRLIRELTVPGTEKARVDPLASIQRMGFDVERAAARNDAARALSEWRNIDPAFANVMRPVPATYTATKDEVKLSVFKNGVRESYVLPQPYENLVNFPPSGGWQDSLLSKAFSVPASILRTGATERNPVFALVGNPIIDTGSYLFSEWTRHGVANTPRIFWNYSRGMYDAFKGIWTGEMAGPAAQRFLLGGGGQGQTLLGRAPTAEQYMGLAARGGQGRFIENRAGLLKFIDDFTTGWVSKFGQRIELGPRIGAMLTEEQAGAGPGLRATMAGREVTQDFALGGIATKAANMWIPYFNVGFQSPNWMYKLMRNDPKGFLATATAMVAMPTIAATAWNRSDPERSRAYDDIPNSDKSQGVAIVMPDPWHPPDKDGRRKPNYVLLPIRNFMPMAVLARESAEVAMTGKSPQDWSRVLADMVTGSTPIHGDSATSAIGGFLPILPAIALQMGTNQDWFRGTWIGTEFNNDRASLPAKAIAGAVGKEPAFVEFAARAAGGGLAGTIIAGVDSAMRIASGQPLTEPAAILAEQPVVGGLVGRFYRRGGGQADQDMATLRDNTKSRLVDDWKQLHPDAPPQAVRTAENQLGDLATRLIYGTAQSPQSILKRTKDILQAMGVTPEQRREELTKVRDALAAARTQAEPQREQFTKQYGIR